MKAKIKHLRFAQIFGRPVAHGQLFILTKEGEEFHCDASLSKILDLAESSNLTIVNSQEILDEIIRKNGFAS